MLYQVIEGKKLYSTGAMWFKIPVTSPNLEEIIAIRTKQILYYSNNDTQVREALLTLANDGTLKNYNEVFIRGIELLVDRMKRDGVTILR
jgi:hypothetical protein